MAERRCLSAASAVECPMIDVEIVRFEEDDIPFGKMLTDAEGWHRTLADWNRLLLIEPSGMFKARSSGRDVGMAGIIAYGRVAWMHSVIVLPQYRAKGVGKALMRACIDRAERQGVESVKLDSVRGFEGFYRGFGFVEEFESMRFLGDGRDWPMTASRARPTDLDAMSRLDRLMTGLDRARVLRAVFRDSPDMAFCAWDGADLVGYVLARPGEERVQIGPCVAKDGDPSVAHELISSLLGSQPSSRFRMCVPAKNVAAVGLARRLGFESARSSTRMYLGRRHEESLAAFAMISPEKG